MSVGSEEDRLDQAIRQALRARPEPDASNDLAHAAMARARRSMSGPIGAWDLRLVRPMRWNRTANIAASILIAALIGAGGYRLAMQNALASEPEATAAQTPAPDSANIDADPGEELEWTSVLLACSGLTAVSLMAGLYFTFIDASGASSRSIAVEW